MAIRSSSFEDELIASLVDPEEAAAYLSAAIRDSRESFLEAMSDVAKAHKMAKVAQEADVERGSLYRMLSPSGNPTWENLSTVLDVMGLTLSVIPKSRSEDAYEEKSEHKPAVEMKFTPQSTVTSFFNAYGFAANDYTPKPESIWPWNVPITQIQPAINTIGVENGYC